MNNFMEGLTKFKKDSFETHKDLFIQLEKAQAPHTLFITCSDSRIVPSWLTDTLPGEIFVIRNIANVVPPYGLRHEHVAISSAIEYAIQVLRVENIIVCGHSNCGGCAALYLSEREHSELPLTHKWLELINNVKTNVSEELDYEIKMKAEMTEHKNIIQQITNLLTYPFVCEKYTNHEINIYGWYYKIETGEVSIYNGEKRIFELVN